MAPASAPRAAAGTELKTRATSPCWMAVTTWGAWPVSDGTVDRACTRWWRIDDVKIDPKAATLVAMPIWRKVVLTPEAMPERSGETTPTAVEATGGLPLA